MKTYLQFLALKNPIISSILIASIIGILLSTCSCASGTKYHRTQLHKRYVTCPSYH